MPKKKRRRRGVEEVRELLRDARERGLSERQLAEHAGVHANTVARWIRRECSEGEVRLESAPSEAAFVPVHVVEPTASAADAGEDNRLGVTLEGAFACRDVHLVLPRGVDTADLRAFFEALAPHAC